MRADLIPPVVIYSTRYKGPQYDVAQLARTMYPKHFRATSMSKEYLEPTKSPTAFLPAPYSDQNSEELQKVYQSNSSSSSSKSTLPTRIPALKKSQPAAKLSAAFLAHTNKTVYISAASPSHISQHFVQDSDESGDSETEDNIKASTEYGSDADSSGSVPHRKVDDALVSNLMNEYFNERGGTLEQSQLWLANGEVLEPVVDRTSVKDVFRECAEAPDAPLLHASNSSDKHWITDQHFPGMDQPEDFDGLVGGDLQSGTSAINLLKSRSPGSYEVQTGDTSPQESVPPQMRGRRTTAMFGGFTPWVPR